MRIHALAHLLLLFVVESDKLCPFRTDSLACLDGFLQLFVSHNLPQFEGVATFFPVVDFSTFGIAPKTGLKGKH